MTGRELASLSDGELEVLAVGGAISPEIGSGAGFDTPETVLVGKVASGRKPAAIGLYSERFDLEAALSLGLIVKVSGAKKQGREWEDFPKWLEPARVPARTFSDLTYAVARTVGDMDRLERAYLTLFRDGGGPEAHAELGFALGYTVADVAAFLLFLRRPLASDREI